MVIGMTALMKLTVSEQRVRKTPHQRVMWLDSDVVLHCPLDEVYHALDEQGVYTLASAGSLGEW